MDISTVVLQAYGITKRFPGVLANDHINLTLNRGEILALLGENGAGKSTLMNMLYGLYHPDEGEIWIKGEQVRLRSPHDAIARGIGMVHQHFQLVPVMTVAENVMLGAEVTPSWPTRVRGSTAISPCSTSSSRATTILSGRSASPTSPSGHASTARPTCSNSTSLPMKTSAHG